MNYERRFGAYIKAERLKSGLRYAEFSRKLGISHTTLSRLENSTQSVTLRTLQLILQRLNASLADIFGREEVTRRHGRRG
jgi:transcriptional regulator with XRE-family HTH domain